MIINFDLKYVTLPFILLLCIVTSYQDMKEGKIRNKWIIASLIVAVLFNLTLIILFLTDSGITSGYLIQSLTNILFAIVAGFGLWYLGIWSAGDGKLFIVLAALIPLSVYSKEYFTGIPSLVLLLNILIIGFAAELIFVIYFAKPSHYLITLKKFAKEFFKFNNIFSEAVRLFAIYWVVEIVLNYFNISYNGILKIAVAIGFSMIIQSKLKKISFWFFTALVAIRIIFDRSVLTWNFLISFLILLFIWRFVRSLMKKGIISLGQIVLSEEVMVYKLKPGMILNETIRKRKIIEDDEQKKILENGGEIIKVKDYFCVKKPKEILGHKGDIDEEDGLTPKQIKHIKELGLKVVKVAKTMPFAPIMFVGTVFTYVLQSGLF